MKTLEEIKKEKKPQILSEEEKNHLDFIFSRLETAKKNKQQRFIEFDGMTLDEYIESNAKLMNAYIPPRKNKTDVNIILGSPRQKAKSILSHIIRMSFDADVMAFDRDDVEDVYFGYTCSKMLKKADEIDSGDYGGGRDEKFLLRAMKLVEQGTVFIREKWAPLTYNKKDIIEGKLDPRVGFKGLKWLGKKQTEYKAESQLLDPTQVYLGNIKEYEMNRQPYIFTRIVIPYVAAEMIYGQWSDWKHVVPGNKYQEDSTDGIPYRDFRLYELLKNEVEIIEYEDFPKNEYQIIINGVKMLPEGFPMFWAWKGYSMSKSVLFPFSDQFAYGKSLMAEIRGDGELLDEMVRMMLHKTLQSIKPPMGNLSPNQLSSRIYDPGTIWNGLNPDMLKKIIDHNGVTSSEYQMFDLLRGILNEKTVNPTFTGQESGENTATAIMEMQRQSMINLGLMLLAIELMEEKRDFLKLAMILDRWTKPIDYELDEKGELKKLYRKINLGEEDLEFSEEAPKREGRIKLAFDLQKEMVKKGRTTGTKRNKTVVHLPLLDKLKYRFFIKVNPSQRASDNLNKVLFSEMMGQALSFFPQEMNRDYFKREWAMIWEKNPAEAFIENSMKTMEQFAQPGQTGQPIEVAGQIKKGMQAPIQQEQASLKQLI